MSVLLKPHRSVSIGPETTAHFHLADCLEVFEQLPAHSVDVIVTSPPYNLGHQLQPVPGHAVGARLSGVDEHVDRGGGAGAAAGRVALPERRRQAERSVDGARRRAGRARAPAAAEHHPLDQVDRHRAVVGRRGGGADARPRDRPLQADQQRSLSERLPRVHLPPDAAAARRASTASRSASRTRISRTSPAGGRRPTASAAAATRGSSRTRRSSGATAIARIRRRSRRGCPSSACGCTG